MMLSRVGERVFWLARYLERIENTARLINVHTSLLMDLPEHREINWYTLVTIFDAKNDYFDRHDRVNEYDIMHFLLADSSYSGSLVNALLALRENARTSLDILPETLWEQVNELHLLVKEEMSSIGNRRRRQNLLLSIVERCLGIWGIIANHMSRNYAYDFLLAGKYLERADMTSRILEMTSILVADKENEITKQYESILWGTLLRALSAQQMFTQHHATGLKADKVLTFLITDSRFPRSLSFAITALGKYLTYLPNPDNVLALQAVLLERLQAYEADSSMLAMTHQQMDKLQHSLNAVNHAIANQWFYPDFATT